MQPGQPKNVVEVTQVFYSETVECMINAGSVWFKLYCEILLLLNTADMGRLLCVRLE